jgi:hypothetical protein
VIRVYVDISVFGRVFDREFKDASLSFFKLSKARIFQIIISVVTKESDVIVPSLQVCRIFDCPSALRPIAYGSPL